MLLVIAAVLLDVKCGAIAGAGDGEEPAGAGVRRLGAIYCKHRWPGALSAEEGQAFLL